MMTVSTRAGHPARLPPGPGRTGRCRAPCPVDRQEQTEIGRDDPSTSLPGLSRLWAWARLKAPGAVLDDNPVHQGIGIQAFDALVEIFLAAIVTQDHLTVGDVGGGAGLGLMLLITRRPDHR